MTDLAVDFKPPSFDEEELFSPKESTPKISAPASPPAEAKCPECGSSFTGPFRNRLLGAHRKAKHGVAGTSKPKGATKRPADATRPRSPSRSSSTSSAGTASGRRRPLGEGLGDILEKVAGVFANVNPPAGNALAFAAPALGNSIDRVVAGTYVDKKLLQPAASGSEKWGALAGAAGLPVMVLAVSAQPALFGVLEGEMRKAMVVCLRERVVVLKKRRAEEKKVTDALAELAELDPELANSDDPIGDLLRGIFVSVTQADAPQD